MVIFFFNSSVRSVVRISAYTYPPVYIAHTKLHMYSCPQVHTSSDCTLRIWNNLISSSHIPKLRRRQCLPVFAQRCWRVQLPLSFGPTEVRASKRAPLAWCLGTQYREQYISTTPLQVRHNLLFTKLPLPPTPQARSGGYQKTRGVIGRASAVLPRQGNQTQKAPRKTKQITNQKQGKIERRKKEKKSGKKKKHRNLRISR